MFNFHKKTILIAPLDWGIGHATRIVPIINKLKKNNKLILAADNLSYEFLKKEFSLIKIIRFPSFNIQYSKRAKLLAIKMLFASPKVFWGIFREHIKTKKIIKEHKIDIIISDNRFGLWNKKIYCIYLTHQIMIKMPKSLKFMEYPIFMLNKFFINKYDECWIPDFEGKNNISGDLAHKYKAHKNTRFLGILSRFSKYNYQTAFKMPDSFNKFDIVAIISGPEPQKTIFFELIYNQLKETNYKTLIISGKPDKTEHNQHENILIVSHLETVEMYQILKQTDIIISRAGYSSIMDYIALQKTAIIIPTPGQTEQEYLANYLSEKDFFYSHKQKKFNLVKAIDNFSKQKPHFI